MNIRLIMIGLIVLVLGCGVAAAAPNITSYNPSSLTPSSFVGVAQNFDVTVNETCNITWYMNGTNVQQVSGLTDTYTNNTAPAGTYNVTAVASNVNGSVNVSWLWTVNNPAPGITPSPASPVSDNVGDSRTFTVNVNQTANVAWFLNGNALFTNNSVTAASYTNTSAKLGAHNVTAVASNANGSDMFSWVWNVAAVPAPSITSTTPSGNTATDNTGDSRTFTVNTDQSVNATWYLNGSVVSTDTSVMSSSYLNNSAKAGTFNITAFVNNSNGNDVHTWTWTVSNLPLNITGFSPASNPTTTVGNTPEFNITTNQVCTVTWKENGSVVKSEPGVTFSTYNDTTAAVGTYNITATVTNANGTLTKSWIWNVKPQTYFTGNGVWDGTAGLSLDYTWNALSYSGFYYDLDSGLGSESMTLHLDSTSDRSIGDNDLNYTTSPIETDFEHGAWGKYEVIGFMAERYFAGYTVNTSTAITTSSISMMARGQLSKVLIDDDEKQSVYSGSALILEDGYALNIVELDKDGNKVFVTLTKDGDELDSGVLSTGTPYIYEADIGDLDDVPMVIVNFKEIFSGIETNAVFVEGIFQISDDYLDLNSGDEFGIMEIKSISATKIEMENEDSFSLSKGDTVEIMGKLKFLVADDNTLRFAPFVDMSDPGTYELRGTIAEDQVYKWTPLNFEGFYYDIDEGIQSESLEVKTLAGRTIASGQLVYTAVPVTTTFEHSAWGSYEVIGFMAEKYFAGYLGTTTFTGALSTMSSGQLSKVLIDDDDQKSIYGGSALILEDGYSLSIVEVDKDGGKVFVELEKDGDEVDSGIVSSNDDYIYETDLGDMDDVPIIVVHFDEIFRGTETNAVFVEGIFQISDDYLELEGGDSYDEMEITSVTSTKIEMKNEDSIDLGKGDEIELMGEVMINVADDSSSVRYYPYVEEETEPSDSLEVDLSASTIKEGESVTITVTSRGSLISDAEVRSEGSRIGTTDEEGRLTYTFSDEGIYTIVAEKEQYVDSAGVDIEVISPEDEARKMSIEPPEVIYEGDTVTFTVVRSIDGEALEDVDVTYDGKYIGTTDAIGEVAYTVKEAGMHKLVATSDEYLDSELNIEVKALEARFDFADLVLSPLEVSSGDDVTITLNATNTGQARGSYEVELLINGNATQTLEISLDVGESTDVEFIHTAGEPGTYLVKVEGMTRTLEVEEGSNTILYLLGGAGLAVIGGAVYLFTAGGWTAEIAGAKMGEAFASLSEKVSQMLSSIRK